MALTTKLATVLRNAMVDGGCALANTGWVKLYTGVQPSDPNSAASGTLLASLRLAGTAFQPSVNGVATANAITDDNSAANTGTAGYFRVYKSDGVTPLWDGSVGTSGTNLVMNSTAIQQGAKVSVTAFTHTVPQDGA